MNLFAQNAACSQYSKEICEGSLPMTGLTLAILVILGLLALGVGFYVRMRLNEEEEED